MLTNSIQIMCDSVNPDGDCLKHSPPAETVKAARELAIEAGWHLAMVEHGYDFCPNCWKMKVGKNEMS